MTVAGLLAELDGLAARLEWAEAADDARLTTVLQDTPVVLRGSVLNLLWLTQRAIVTVETAAGRDPRGRLAKTMLTTPFSR